jgi:Zn-dependent protease with chaperone function
MTDMDPPIRTVRTLTDIDPRAWEHPADRAALAALRRIPVFDEVLRKVFGLFGEKPIRLSFQANAVRVGPRQFPDIYKVHRRVLRTLDADEDYPLFVSQTPVVNAGAYGMNHPFIILNSGLVRLFDEQEQTYLIGHELGHILSGHVLYKTMTVLLLQLAQMGFPVVGIAARVVLMALLEWSRKAELSCDRAGILAVQDPEVALRAFMKLAGGGRPEETDLNEFLVQADEYRESGDVADSVFKVLNLLGETHPFAVLRAAEARDWVEKGEYDRILRGEYQRRTDEKTAYKEDLAEAGRAYKEDAKGLWEQFEGAARKIREDFMAGLRHR